MSQLPSSYVNNSGLSFSAKAAQDAGAFQPYANNLNFRDVSFAPQFTGNLAQGVEANPTAEGYYFRKAGGGQQLDMMGNPYNRQEFGTYGTPITQDIQDAVNSYGGLQWNPSTGGIANYNNPMINDYLAAETGAGGNYGEAVGRLNLASSSNDRNLENLRAQQAYDRSNSDVGGGFGGFLRKVALPAAGLFAAGVGGLGGLGSLGLGSGATGVSAGGATAGVGGGLGSTLGGYLAPLSTKAGLTGLATGALGGYAGGGDIGSALKGAALGGITGGYGGQLSNSLGLGKIGSSVFEGALKGASGGLASGNTDNALFGGALGGAGGLLTSGINVPFLGQASTVGAGGMGPATQGSGILGKLTLPTNLGTTGGTGMFGGNTKLGSLGKIGTGSYDYISSKKTNEKIEDALLQAQRQAQSVLDPYQQSGAAANEQLIQALQAGFNPQDLQNDAGYQFQRAQGEEALSRNLAGRGLGQSGAAIKAALEYNTGLADQTYNDAYNRWLSQNSQLAGLSGQGANAALGLGSLYQNTGNIRAQALSQLQDTRNSSLANILSGIGGLF
jgi:hypothetical protein